MKKIALSGVHGKGKFALVDDQDYGQLAPHKWYLNSYGYALGYIEGRTQLMHRLVTNCPKGVLVDHRNHDKLNNTQSNLRLCTRFENAHNKLKYSNNTSGYKGVYFDVTAKKWRAAIRLAGVRLHVGYFRTPEEASLAYNQAALKYHGDFASLNVA